MTQDYGREERPVWLPAQDSSSSLPGSGSMISRRKLLASLGMAGAAAAVGGLLQGSVLSASTAQAAEEEEDCCINGRCVRIMTLAELRSHEAPEAGDVYYIRDAGKEGHFSYEPLDTASADNTGTIVVSATGHRYKRIIRNSLDVSWFGAIGDGVSDDTAAVQAAFGYAAELGGAEIQFRSNKQYKLTATITIPSRTNVRGNNATILFAGNHTVLFHTYLGNEIYLERLLCIDSNQNNTAIYLEGSGAGNISFYSTNIDLFALHIVNFQLALRSMYARQWKMDRCNIYCKNGVAIQNKSVEINIVDTIIFGSGMETDSFGIKAETISASASDWPEGVMVSGCTLDNFDRTIWLQNMWVFQLANSYCASQGTGRYAFFAGKGTGTHCQDFTITNVEFNGRGVIFQPNSAAPVQYKAVFSNCLFQNVSNVNIELRKFAYDISFNNCRFECFPSTNASVAVCYEINQGIQFSSLITNSFPIYGIQVKGEYSTVAIRGFDYYGSGSALYLQQSTYLESIRSSYADTQTRGYLHKYIPLPAGTYNPNDMIGSVAMNIADGQKGTLVIQGLIQYTGAAPELEIIVPDNSLALPAGAGWNSLRVQPGTSGQYVSVSVPFQVAANNGIYSIFGINNGVFGLKVATGSASAVTFGNDAYLSIRLED